MQLSATLCIGGDLSMLQKAVFFICYEWSSVSWLNHTVIIGKDKDYSGIHDGGKSAKSTSIISLQSLVSSVWSLEFRLVQFNLQHRMFFSFMWLGTRKLPGMVGCLCLCLCLVQNLWAGFCLFLHRFLFFNRYHLKPYHNFICFSLLIHNSQETKGSSLLDSVSGCLENIIFDINTFK